MPRLYLPMFACAGVALGFRILAAQTMITVAGTGEPAMNALNGSTADFNIGQPFGVEIGPDGSLYVCEVENHRVLRVDLASGYVTTVAGNGQPGSVGDGGKATDAQLFEPYEARFDGDGNLYVVEMRGAVVRRVHAANGIIETVAGTGEPGFGGDGGPAVMAQLRQPHSIALDDKDGLFIADIGNHRIRRVDLKSGLIDTVAGDGQRKLPGDGQAAKGMPLLGPRALCFDSDGLLWIALREGHSVWTLDLATNRLRHIAGGGEKGYRDGPGDLAMFNGPKGIVADNAGSVYVVDTENQVIRRIDANTRVVATAAGVGPGARGYQGDGGPARKAWMDRPHGIAAAAGILYVGDTNNHRVRRVSLP